MTGIERVVSEERKNCPSMNNLLTSTSILSPKQRLLRLTHGIPAPVSVYQDHRHTIANTNRHGSHTHTHITHPVTVIHTKPVGHSVDIQATTKVFQSRYHYQSSKSQNNKLKPTHFIKSFSNWCHVRQNNLNNLFSNRNISSPQNSISILSVPFCHFRHFHSWNAGKFNNLNSRIRMESEKSTSNHTNIVNGVQNNIAVRSDGADAGAGGGGGTSTGGGGGGGPSGGSLSLPAWEVTTMKNAKDIFKGAVNSVLPKEMVAKHLMVDPNGDVMTIQDKSYRLNGNVYVVGFGKAVLGMARAVDDLIGSHVVRGVVSVPQGTQEEFRDVGKIDMLLGPDSSIKVREGAANNMPDRSAHDAALEIADLVRSVGDGDLLIVLISGGGSALLPAPAPPITLSDMLAVTSQVSRGGSNIGQLNTIRKQLDFLKGGGLAEMASPARVVSLILSDIVGDPIDLIASAPTVADTSTPQDCLSIFSQLNITDAIPKTVTDFLKDKSTLETSDAFSHEHPELSHVQNVIIGSNKIACGRACEESEKLGYGSFVLSTELEGEARDVGKMFARLAAFIDGHFNLLNVKDVNIRKTVNDIRTCLLSEHRLLDSQLDEIVLHVEKCKIESRGVCIVAGGETTVNVTGTGRGGRNQEMATSAGLELVNVYQEMLVSLRNGGSSSSTGKLEGCALNTNTPKIVFLSAGTDGQDGPTTAAGGVVGFNFVESAKRADLNPVLYRNNNDCFTLLNSWGEGFGLVHTGLTGTNVMDIQLLIVQPAD